MEKPIPQPPKLWRMRVRNLELMTGAMLVAWGVSSVVSLPQDPIWTYPEAPLVWVGEVVGSVTIGLALAVDGGLRFFGSTLNKASTAWADQLNEILGWDREEPADHPEAPNQAPAHKTIHDLT